MGTEMEQAGFRLKLNDAGEVVLIRGDERLPLGPRDAACEEMCRFLEEVDFGECAGDQTQK